MHPKLPAGRSTQSFFLPWPPHARKLSGDRVAGLDRVRDGYWAMNKRAAIKVMLRL